MTRAPVITLISAMTRNRVIGRDNGMPWRMKSDLAHFKRSTQGFPIIMGRKTWASLGRPLPKRRNLVVTRTPGFSAEGAEVFDSPRAAIDAAAQDAEEVFIIGGGQIYAQTLAQADRLLLTRIETELEGDSLFPAFDEAQFELLSSETHPADADNEYGYTFLEYRRIR